MSDEKMPPGGDGAPPGRKECDQRDADHHLSLSQAPADCKEMSRSEQAEVVMRKHALTPVGILVADGVLHHADIEGDRPGSQHLWYVIKAGPKPILVFGDFKHRLREEKVVAELHGEGPAPTAAEADTWKRERE